MEVGVGGANPNSANNEAHVGLAAFRDEADAAFIDSETGEIYLVKPSGFYAISPEKLVRIKKDPLEEEW